MEPSEFQDTENLNHDDDACEAFDAEGSDDIVLECPGCEAEVGYCDVGDAGEGAGCPVCGGVFDPDAWFG